MKQSLMANQNTAPRIVAWEITRRCPLACRHCRAAARDTEYAGELTTAECNLLVDGLIAARIPMLILTGGEPLGRCDVWSIAKRAADGGIRVVMASCGIAVDEKTVGRMGQSGVKAISLSMDGATAAQHDGFRGVTGSFAANLKAMDCARRAHLPFQINALVSCETVRTLPDIYELALRSGAFQLDLFFLVPVGRGVGLKKFALNAAQCEEALAWALKMNARGPLSVKTTCAPQVTRVRRQLGLTQPLNGKGTPPSGGCMAGRGFVFVSHTGILQPCGFCDVPAGDLRRHDFNFMDACRTSEVFRLLGDADGYGGKCGICEYRHTCGGCRARALAAAGDYLAEEPACLWQPGMDGHPQRNGIQ